MLLHDGSEVSGILGQIIRRGVGPAVQALADRMEDHRHPFPVLRCRQLQAGVVHLDRRSLYLRKSLQGLDNLPLDPFQRKAVNLGKLLPQACDLVVVPGDILPGGFRQELLLLQLGDTGIEVVDDTALRSHLGIDTLDGILHLCADGCRLRLGTFPVLQGLLAVGDRGDKCLLLHAQLPGTVALPEGVVDLRCERIALPGRLVLVHSLKATVLLQEPLEGAQREILVLRGHL